MDLTGIIAISGKPGLYKVVAQSASSIIVENVENKRRMPAFASNKISALEDITMYTESDDVPLGDVMQNIYEKCSGKQGPDHKEDIAGLRKELDTVLKGCAHDQIYDSDIRKLFQWYNLLQSAGILKERVEEAEKAEKEEKKSDKKEKTDKSATAKATGDTKKEAKKPAADTKKKAAPKKDTASKGGAKKPSGKASGSTKKTTGSQRGK